MYASFFKKKASSIGTPEVLWGGTHLKNVGIHLWIKTGINEHHDDDHVFFVNGSRR